MVFTVENIIDKSSLRQVRGGTLQTNIMRIAGEDSKVHIHSSIRSRHNAHPPLSVAFDVDAVCIDSMLTANELDAYKQNDVIGTVINDLYRGIRLGRDNISTPSILLVCSTLPHISDIKVLRDTPTYLEDIAADILSITRANASTDEATSIVFVYTGIVEFDPRKIQMHTIDRTEVEKKLAASEMETDMNGQLMFLFKKVGFGVFRDCFTEFGTNYSSGRAIAFYQEAALHETGILHKQSDTQTYEWNDADMMETFEELFESTLQEPTFKDTIETLEKMTDFAEEDSGLTHIASKCKTAAETARLLMNQLIEIANTVGYLIQEGEANGEEEQEPEDQCSC